VNSGQIVKGYQYAPDQYAVFTAAETQQFQAAPGRAISVSRFFGWGTIDPLYFSGRHYFLLPAHRRAQQPYAALHQAMLDEQVWGLAEMVIAQREKLVVIRPLKRLLSVSVIHYAAAIRSVADLYAELDDRPMMPQELTRAKTSINALRAELPRLGQFHDPYIERVMAQIEAKIAAGKAASSRLWTAVSRRERT
jgi:DNA end-binding protein Ku